MSTVKSKKLQVGTDATSSNNFTIYQPATPDGTLRIGVGNADNPTEVARFNNNGIQPTKSGLFMAWNNSATTVNNATNTKIPFTTENFDNDSFYDATNSKYIPQIAGWYMVGCRMQMQFTATAGEFFCHLYKNGSSYKRLEGQPCVNGTYSSPQSLIPVYMNGSTDYLEIYAWQTSGVSRTNNNGDGISYFYGYLLQQA